MEFRVIGLKELQARAKRFEKRYQPNSQQVRTVLVRIGNMMRLQIVSDVLTGLDVEGIPFQRLSDSYAASYRGGSQSIKGGHADRTGPRGGRAGGTKRGYDDILKDTGEMIGGVTPRVAGGVLHLTPGPGTEARAAGHQFGIKGRLPKRTWLGWRDSNIGLVDAEIAGWEREEFGTGGVS